jgi:hypothetical protein
VFCKEKIQAKIKREKIIVKKITYCTAPDSSRDQSGRVGGIDGCENRSLSNLLKGFHLNMSSVKEALGSMVTVVLGRFAPRRSGGRVSTGSEMKISLNQTIVILT